MAPNPALMLTLAVRTHRAQKSPHNACIAASNAGGTFFLGGEATFRAHQQFHYIVSVALARSLAPS